jgi:hypothetical protein
MENKKTLQITIAIILMGAASRLFPHLPNVTPLTAMALLGGAYLAPSLALTIPLAALFLSDLFLGLHATMPFVYASFLATAGLGLLLRRNRTSGFILSACLASSALFFLVTNFGVWITSGMYSHNFAGLTACYAAAIPFLRNSALGDVLSTGILFSLEGFALKLFVAEAA